MRRSIVAFAILLMLGTGTAWAAGFVGPRTYYSDAAMTNATGGDWLSCNGPDTWQWGVSSTYRRFEGLHCWTGNDVVICHQWNGSSWVSIACPW